jgi:hypothetical protein
MLPQKFKRTCFKINFDSRKEAKKYIRVTNQIGKSLTEKLVDVYYCEECRAWHTTSRPKGDRTFFREVFKKKKKQ